MGGFVLKKGIERRTTSAHVMVHQEELDNSLFNWLNGKASEVIGTASSKKSEKLFLKKLGVRSSKSTTTSKKFLKKR